MIASMTAGDRVFAPLVVQMWCSDAMVISLPPPAVVPYDGRMPDETLLERVVVDPEICFGKPTIRGTRLWVGLVLGFLADGMTIGQILEEYPQLTEDDVRACLVYAARLTSGRFTDVA